MLTAAGWSWPAARYRCAAQAEIWSASAAPGGWWLRNGAPPALADAARHIEHIIEDVNHPGPIGALGLLDPNHCVAGLLGRVEGCFELCWARRSGCVGAPS